MKTGLDFDDVLILPSPSSIDHRDNVDISVDMGNLHLSFPIIVSPMKGIVSLQLINAISDLGGIGIFHRFQSEQELLNDVFEAKARGSKFGVSIGLGQSYAALLKYEPNILCIDVANGYLDSVLRFSYEVAIYIAERGLDTLLMAGNVVTQKGAEKLINAGVNLIRVGIGGGSLCTTRDVTGVGCPQLTALQDCAKASDYYKDVYIISDGGAKNSGDIVKALVFGADCVMMGGMFGRTYESAHDGLIYGMASRNLQEEYYHSKKSIEGTEMKIHKNVSAEELISELCWGIKSACTYLNSETLLDLRDNIENVIHVENKNAKWKPN